MSILKPVVFGFVIAIVASFQGMSVQKASTEVPQRTIRTVVQSLFLIIVLDILITYAFWGVA